MNERWRIEKLQAMTAAALQATDCEQAPSGRVRAIPDARTIRYYTTLGLIDRPAEMRGRTAYYGRRHLLQLVCIKRLQAEGRPLLQIQQELAGASNRRLAEWAKLPRGFWERTDGGAEPAAKSSVDDTATRNPEGAGGRQFWLDEARPAPPLAPAANGTPIECLRLPFADGALLELEGVDAQQMNEAAWAALQPTLRQLADQLRKLRLTRGGSPDDADPEP